jgi:hypothetical protein
VFEKISSLRAHGPPFQRERIEITDRRVAVERTGAITVLYALDEHGQRRPKDLGFRPEHDVCDLPGPGAYEHEAQGVGAGGVSIVRYS